jgi:hypothetical protein
MGGSSGLFPRDGAVRLPLRRGRAIRCGPSTAENQRTNDNRDDADHAEHCDGSQMTWAVMKSERISIIVEGPL